jgi:hypothetical protein
MGAYTDISQILYADRLFKYNNQLIAYTKTSKIFNRFGYGSYNFIGNSTINEFVVEYHHVVSKNVILYLTVDGRLEYQSASVFPSSSSGNKNSIDQNFMPDPTRVIF